MDGTPGANGLLDLPSMLPVASKRLGAVKPEVVLLIGLDQSNGAEVLAAEVVCEPEIEEVLMPWAALTEPLLAEPLLPEPLLPELPVSELPASEVPAAAPIGGLVTDVSTVRMTDGDVDPSPFSDFAEPFAAEAACPALFQLASGLPGIGVPDWEIMGCELPGAPDWGPDVCPAAVGPVVR